MVTRQRDTIQRVPDKVILYNGFQTKLNGERTQDLLCTKWDFVRTGYLKRIAIEAEKLQYLQVNSGVQDIGSALDKANKRCFHA